MTLSLFGFKASGLQRQRFVWAILLSLVKGTFLTLPRLFMIVSLSVLCLYGVMFMRGESPVLDQIKSFSLDITAPLVEWINRPIHLVQQNYAKLRDFNQLQENLTSLQKENFQLEEWKSLALQLKRENQNLRELLRTLPALDQSFFTAKVLGSPAGSEYSTLLIAATKTDGIVKNAPVVCAKGVVGRVIDVGLLVSRVALLTDLNARTPVRFETTGEQAILAGAGTAELMIIHRKQRYETDREAIVKEHAVKVGDRLITSGFGGIYPPDLAVATITRIQKDPDGDKIYARLIATPSTLEFVRILDSLDAQNTPS
jgi:rod shape-determining protein MreC